jgi:CheY-like chemotaxis protein
VTYREMGHVRGNLDSQTILSPVTRILLIEDNESVASALSDLLTYEGYEVAVCGSGEAALAHLRTERLPDLILLDLLLPGMTGAVLLQRLRQNRALAGIRVIVVSAICDPADVERMQVAACFTKPVEVPDLLRAIAGEAACSRQGISAVAPTDEHEEDPSWEEERTP